MVNIKSDCEFVLVATASGTQSGLALANTLTLLLIPTIAVDYLILRLRTQPLIIAIAIAEMVFLMATITLVIRRVIPAIIAGSHHKSITKRRMILAREFLRLPFRFAFAATEKPTIPPAVVFSSINHLRIATPSTLNLNITTLPIRMTISLHPI
jgi:hypothetical protein